MSSVYTSWPIYPQGLDISLTSHMMEYTIINQLSYRTNSFLIHSFPFFTVLIFRFGLARFYRILQIHTKECIFHSQLSYRIIGGCQFKHACTNFFHLVNPKYTIKSSNTIVGREYSWLKQIKIHNNMSRTCHLSQ